VENNTTESTCTNIFIAVTPLGVVIVGVDVYVMDFHTHDVADTDVDGTEEVASIERMSVRSNVTNTTTDRVRHNDIDHVALQQQPSSAAITIPTTIPTWLQDVCHRLIFQHEHPLHVLNLNIRRLVTLEMMQSLCDALDTNHTIRILNLTTTLAKASSSLIGFTTTATTTAIVDHRNQLSQYNQVQLNVVSSKLRRRCQRKKRKRGDVLATVPNRSDNDDGIPTSNIQHRNDQLFACFIQRILSRHPSLQIIHMSYNQFMEYDDLMENDDFDEDDDDIECVERNHRHIETKREDHSNTIEVGSSGKGGLETTSHNVQHSNSYSCDNPMHENDMYHTNIKIGLALGTNQCLLELHIDHNRLTSLSAYYIAIGLRTNTTLQLLQLSDNCIGDEGCHYIAHTLSFYNRTLRTIRLDHNMISDVGANHLYQSLSEHNFSLKYMALDRNPAIVQQYYYISQINLLSQANRIGRQYIMLSTMNGDHDHDSGEDNANHDNCPSSLNNIVPLSVLLPLCWPIILAKMNTNPSLMFYFITHKPDMIMGSYFD
jgi:Leucine Rich repeat